MKSIAKSRKTLHILLCVIVVFSLIFMNNHVFAATPYSYEIPFEITSGNQTQVSFDITTIARSQHIQSGEGSFFYPGSEGTIYYNINNETNIPFIITGYSIEHNFTFDDDYWNKYGAGKDKSVREAFFWSDIFTFSLGENNLCHSIHAYESMDFPTAFEGYLTDGIAANSDNTLKLSYDFDGGKMSNEYMNCRFSAIVTLFIEPADGYGETPAPTETAAATPTEEIKATPSPTEEVTATPTQEITEMPSPTEEVTATPTQEITEMPSPTEEVTATPTQEITEAPSPTEEVTATPTQEITEIPSPTEEVTEVPTGPHKIPVVSSPTTNGDDEKKDPSDPNLPTGDRSIEILAVTILLSLSSILFIAFKKKHLT